MKPRCEYDLLCNNLPECFPLAERSLSGNGQREESKLHHICKMGPYYAMLEVADCYFGDGIAEACEAIAFPLNLVRSIQVRIESASTRVAEAIQPMILHRSPRRAIFVTPSEVKANVGNRMIVKNSDTFAEAEL